MSPRRIYRKVCSTPGCPRDAQLGTSWCDQHEPTPWAGSTRRSRLPPDWRRTRARILRRDGHTCYLCSQPAQEVDHVRPGDDHADTNLAAICTPCHLRKSAAEGAAARQRKNGTQSHHP